MKHITKVTVSKAAHCGAVSDKVSLLSQLAQGDPLGCFSEIMKLS